MDSEVYKNLSLQLSEMMLAIESLHKKQFYPLMERWLDNQEVCLALKISKRSLQSYRSNGTLPFSQVGSKIYYKAKGISLHLEKHYNKSF